ncbi:hypothetical protein HDE_00540 [Halotydeus destructor]|nr:hypothetical protein HDE_00540 [Halotydeus destructor]
MRQPILTMKVNIVILFPTAISLISCCRCDVSYSSTCGVPPVPPLATFEGTRHWLEGAELEYQCQHYLNHIHTLVCRDGAWEGPKIRCGQSMDNDVVKVDIENQLGNTTTEVTQAVNDHDFNISYRGESATRVSTENLTSGTTYRWTIHLNLSVDIGFLRLDLGKPVGSDQLFDIVDVYVGPNKVCQQTKVDLSGERNFTLSNNRTVNRADFWFECDLTGGAEGGVVSKYFAFTTNSSAPLTIDLAGVFVAMPVDRCGRPERPPFLSISSNVDGENTKIGSHIDVLAVRWKQKALKVEYADTIHHNSETYLVDQSSVAVTCQENDTRIFTTCRDGSWDAAISCEAGSASKSLWDNVTISVSALVVICICAVISMGVYITKTRADKGSAGVKERSQDSKTWNHYDSIRYSDIRGSGEYIDADYVAQNGDYEEVAHVNLYDDAV